MNRELIKRRQEGCEFKATLDCRVRSKIISWKLKVMQPPVSKPDLLKPIYQKIVTFQNIILKR